MRVLTVAAASSLLISTVTAFAPMQAQFAQFEQHHHELPELNTEKRKKRSMRRQIDSASSFTKPKLTAQQEQEYSFRIRTFRAAIKMRDQLVRFQNGVYIHPTEAEWAAACGTSVGDLQRVIEEGKQARSSLITSNTGLVVQQAKKYNASLKHATSAGGGVGTILSISDMIQEGNLGLMEAAERFEPEKGFRFSTYATYWVRQRILRSISDSSRTIRLPAHVHDTLQKIRKAKVEMKRETGKEPSLSELAHYMEVSEEKLRLYTASSRNVVSLERPVTSSKNDGRQTSTLGDFIACESPTPEEDAVLNAMRHDVRSVLNNELSGLEHDVVVHRFGINKDQPRTVAETATVLNISRDRVRVLEAKAMNKLRNFHKLKDYFQGEMAAAEIMPPPSQVEKRAEPAAPASPSNDRIWFF